MLISHDYKFIYIKTRKTASTTVERYLQKFCKNGVAQVKKAHKQADWVKDQVGEEIWNSYKKICVIRNPWDKSVSNYFWRRRFRKWNYFLYKINPKLSNYNAAHYLNFNDYILSGHYRNLDEGILFIDGEWPDFEFIRYEHLNSDLERVCGIIGVPYKKSRVGKYKSGYRPKVRYQKFYNDKARDYVAKLYSREIEKFGYTFD